MTTNDEMGCFTIEAKRGFTDALAALAKELAGTHTMVTIEYDNGSVVCFGIRAEDIRAGNAEQVRDEEVVGLLEQVSSLREEKNRLERENMSLRLDLEGTVSELRKARASLPVGERKAAEVDPQPALPVGEDGIELSSEEEED